MYEARRPPSSESRLEDAGRKRSSLPRGSRRPESSHSRAGPTTRQLLTCMTPAAGPFNTSMQSFNSESNPQRVHSGFLPTSSDWTCRPPWPALGPLLCWGRGVSLQSQWAPCGCFRVQCGVTPAPAPARSHSCRKQSGSRMCGSTAQAPRRNATEPQPGEAERQLGWAHPTDKGPGDGGARPAL